MNCTHMIGLWGQGVDYLLYPSKWIQNIVPQHGILKAGLIAGKGFRLPDAECNMIYRGSG